ARTLNESLPLLRLPLRQREWIRHHEIPLLFGPAILERIVFHVGDCLAYLIVAIDVDRPPLPTPARRRAIPRTNLAGEWVNIPFDQRLRDLAFQKVAHSLALVPMAHIDGMEVIVEDRHGPEGDARPFDVLGNPLGDNADLLVGELHGRVVENFLGRLAQVPVVGAMGDEIVGSKLGRRAEPKEFEFANGVGSRPPGVVWEPEAIGAHDQVVGDDHGRPPPALSYAGISFSVRADGTNAKRETLN